MKIEEIKVKDYEKVFQCKDEESKLNAVIAIHNSNRGKICLGGCRMHQYPDDKDMLKDALILSKKMTYKNALANLNFGGAKCIIRGNPEKDKTENLLLAMAEFVNYFEGEVYTGQDSGITEEDVETMSQKTKYLVGRKLKSGDPSIPTGLGIYVGIKSAVKEILNKDSLKELTIVVYGLGNVGLNLLEHLSKEECKIIVSDAKKEKIEFAVKKYGVTPFYDVENIFSVPCSIFSPNVTGSTINGGALDEDRINLLYKNKLEKYLIIAGGTNVPLVNTELIKKINSLENLFLIPPEVINAGGVISVASDITGETKSQVKEKVTNIGKTISEMIQRAKKEKRPLNEIAEEIAYDRIYKKS